MSAHDAPEPPSPGSAREVFGAFLRLGLTSFGGPVAHLAYFRTEFVERRRWLDDGAFGELLAICQLLPGPASSKLGLTLGLLRAGWAGAAAAWLAFTLPSAIAMYAFASATGSVGDGVLGAGLVHGLKLAAVAIVAHAAWRMATSLCPDTWRRALAIAVAVLVLATGGGAMQFAAIALGAVVGVALGRDVALPSMPAGAFARTLVPGISHRVATAAALAYAGLLAAALAASGDSPAAMAAAFYHAGALVFGGGHVVLPLLDAAVVQPAWCAREAFLAGYGAAQAVPGPLFTFAAFLGAQPGMPVPGPSGAALALLAIFLPGVLLQIAALGSWATLRTRPGFTAAIRGVNAAVVGILVAALWTPVWTGSVDTAADAAVAIAGFALLAATRIPPLAVVVGAAIAGVAIVASGTAG
jgi:chromate transporter